jgi:putative transposase
MALSRSAYYSPPADEDRDQPVIDALNALVEKHSRWGFWMMFRRLRRLGHPWNHKRVYRVYCAMRLNLPRRTKKRVPTRTRVPLEVVMQPNESWSIDFMSDALYNGRRFRVLNVLDEGVREALDIVIDTSIPSGRLVRTLDQLVSWRGAPRSIRCDNGPEMCSEAFLAWCERHGVTPRHIQPGKPNQNAYIERFNRTFREEVLDSHLFSSIDQVREIADGWRWIYNRERPHDALGGVPPTEFRRGLKLEISTYQLSA